MHFIVGILVILIVVYACSWSSNPTLRWFSRMGMLFSGLGCLLIALACVIFPMTSGASGAGVLMLFSIIPGGIGLFILSLWLGANDGEAYRNMSELDQQSYTRRQFKEAEDSFSESMSKKRDEAEGFFTGLDKRTCLKKQARNDESMLSGLGPMKDSYEEHLKRRKRGEPEPSVIDQLRKMWNRVISNLRPPNRKP